MRVTRLERERARAMYAELSEHKLEVVLVPAPSPAHTDHYIRCVIDQPPRWFSEYAQRYLRSSQRYPRPRPNFIKRACSLRALAALSNGVVDTVYAQRWYSEIRRLIANEEVPF